MAYSVVSFNGVYNMVSFLKPRSWLKERTLSMVDWVEVNKGPTVSIELIRAVCDLHSLMSSYTQGGSNKDIEKRWIKDMLEHINWIIDEVPASNVLARTCRLIRIELNGHLSLMQIEYKIPYIFYGKK